jgi:hypothetical protein
MNPGQTPEERQIMDDVDPRCLESDVGSVRSARDVDPKRVPRSPSPPQPPFTRDRRLADISISTIRTALLMIEQHGCCWGPDVADAEIELAGALSALEST